MSAVRGEFSSRLGFILAAAGSAVGLGNIWGFPTNAASNGGAAFLVAYLVLAFGLAYPSLMAELIIGRYAKANTVTALQRIARGPVTRRIGAATGFVGIFAASLILSFYAIIAGWVLAYVLAPFAHLAGAEGAASWLMTSGLTRNAVFDLLFMLATVAIVSAGVREGIERWSTRLMPLLILILILLIFYVMTLDGAMEGVRAYLVPDFSRVLDPSLLVSAMGQAFFSMSLGVGTMLIYASYVSPKENLATLGRSVTLIDISIAFMAGLLILPAMYVAQQGGVAIYDAAGNLIAGDALVFTVLPALFDSMGAVGIPVFLAFFVLMTIAALTSSISMLEVPVAYAIENRGLARHQAALLIGGLITLISLVMVFNFETLFGLVVAGTTQFAQPLLGIMLCIYAGWVWHRNQLLAEIKQGFPEVERSLFWKIWPFYVRFVCPLAIFVVFAQSALAS